MRIKFLTSAAGAHGSFAPGQVGDVPADEAKRLIAAGYAEAATPKIETATKKAPRKAVRR